MDTAWRTRQRQAPFFDSVRDFVGRGILPFHTPGHKQGKGAERAFREFVGENALSIDLSEVEAPHFGHDQSAVIREAEELAAEAYGADRTFFLVNGTTSGIHAMIMAACNPGDEIIVPRNVHRSIIGGIILAGATPVYLPPQESLEYGISMGLMVSDYQDAIKAYPKAKAVLVINPSYYGISSDLKAVVEMAHAQRIPVLVDEAHGPHLCFHPRLPTSAMECGADASAQSTHKILGSMTQASMLHLQGSRIDRGRAQAMLGLLKSTSPSYLLLASLDVARRQMALEGRELLAGAISLAEEARSRINAIPGLHCFGQEVVGEKGVVGLDPTKLTIRVSELGFTGQMAESFLRERHGIQVELSDLHNILVLLTFGDGRSEVECLMAALEDLARSQPAGGPLSEWTRLLYAGFPPIPPQKVPPREAFFSPTHRVPFKAAVGQISAELVAPYPPGIPVLCPGEEITQEVVDYLVLVKEVGITIQGPEDPDLRRIRVVGEGVE